MEPCREILPPNCDWQRRTTRATDGRTTSGKRYGGITPQPPKATARPHITSVSSPTTETFSEITSVRVTCKHGSGSTPQPSLDIPKPPRLETESALTSSKLSSG